MQSVIENTDLPTPLQQRCAWQTIIIELTDMKDHVMSGRGCVQVPLYLHFQSGGCIWNQHFFALLEVCINSKKWLTACLERQHFKRQWISLTMLSVFQHWQETKVIVDDITSYFIHIFCSTYCWHLTWWLLLQSAGGAARLAAFIDTALQCSYCSMPIGVAVDLLYVLWICQSCSELLRSPIEMKK